MRGPLPGHPHLHDLGLFVATVVVAAWQGWSTTDLVWSLWISSLLVGYGFVVVTLFVGNEGGGEDDGDLPRALGLAFTLAGLVFFTFHFGLFHFVHSVFLNQFFPLVDPSAGLFGGAGGPVWWGHLIAEAVERYWPFLLATVLSRRLDFLASVRADPERGTTRFGPYRSVVRMHLLIFVFAGLEAARLRGYALYAVLVFYFFPLGALKGLAGRIVAGGR